MEATPPERVTFLRTTTDIMQSYINVNHVYFLSFAHRAPI